MIRYRCNISIAQKNEFLRNFITLQQFKCNRQHVNMNTQMAEIKLCTYILYTPFQFSENNAMSKSSNQS